MDLIRRVEGVEAFALTSPLVTTSDGKKMGKSERGALYLDPAITSPYDFYQYWVNVTDADTAPFLKRFTYLPVAEIDELCAVKDQRINNAKRRLAFEVTALVHGADAAHKAADSSKAAFSGGDAGQLDLTGVPSVTIPRSELAAGISAVDLFVRSTLCATKSDARRLIEQGGALVGKTNVKDINALVTLDAAESGTILLRAGKKRYFRIVVG
jgi:tyrosyl-tRNA synthetase